MHWSKPIRLAIPAFVFLISLTVNSYFEPTSQGQKPREMNGIFYDQNKDFTKTWHLVTVRYRQDSGEMRFVYANDLAFNAMNSLKPDYPDGAMFGKVAFVTEDDPAFKSSKVPSGAKRVQFMLKNKKYYPDTKGWGYALFDERGNLFNEDMKLKTSSCLACHQIVPERDYIFSRPMLLHHDSAVTLTEKATKENGIVFENRPIEKMPRSVRTYLKKFQSIATLQGELQKTAFSGALDETIPILSEKTKLTGTPAALIFDEKNFSLVIPKQNLKKCLTQNSLLKPFRILIQYNGNLVRDADVCL